MKEDVNRSIVMDNIPPKPEDGLNLPRSVRRILLADSENGTSFVARDEQIDPVAFANIGQLYSIYGTDSIIDVASSTDIATFEGTFPPVGGFRVFATRFAPTGVAGVWGDEMPSHLNMPSASAMHRSDTCDVNIVLKGTLDCVLSDQSVITLNSGDVIVLNGAEHCWRNHSADQEAIMLFFMTGATRL